MINQKVLVRQLKIAGYDVSTAGNGQEALDMITQNAQADSRARFSVVLMDIEVRVMLTPSEAAESDLLSTQMPVMDGLTAIKEIRQREIDGSLKIRYVSRGGPLMQALAANCVASISPSSPSPATLGRNRSTIAWRQASTKWPSSHTRSNRSWPRFLS